MRASTGALLAVALTFAMCFATALASGVPLHGLGTYFDGHLYIEIARSYPLPYPPEAHLYAGQAPGYPAAIALGRLLLPDGWFNWAELALLASWLGAAASAAAFHLLCRSWGITSIWPTLLFVVANPRWLSVATAPHAEPLAMFFAVASLTAYVRDRTGWALALLALATLCRFPALVLGASLAWGLLIGRRRWDLRTLLWLGCPIVALGLLHLYLAWRIPGFVSVWHSHQPFWETEPALPFIVLIRGQFNWPALLPLREVTYGTLVLYGLAFVLALRPSVRDGRVLALWIAAAALLPLSLTGESGIIGFTRQALLAWPAALLVMWCGVGERLPRAVVAVLVVAMCALSFWFASQQIRFGASFQAIGQPDIHQRLERLDADEPVFIQKPYSLR